MVMGLPRTLHWTCGATSGFSTRYVRQRTRTVRGAKEIETKREVILCGVYPCRYV